MGDDAGLRADLFNQLQPVAARAAAAFWYSCAGGEPDDAPPPNEGDHALAAEVTIAVIDRMLEVLPAREEDRAAAELDRLRRMHGLYVDGPLRHPGGKDGAYEVVCTCGWRSSPGGSPRARGMWDAGRAHSEAKRLAGGLGD